MKTLTYVKSLLPPLKKNQKTLEFKNLPRLRKFSRLLNLSLNDMEGESLAIVHTFRIEISPEK